MKDTDNGSLAVTYEIWCHFLENIPYISGGFFFPFNKKNTFTSAVVYFIDTYVD